jgi:hypothetical protein
MVNASIERSFEEKDRLGGYIEENKAEKEHDVKSSSVHTPPSTRKRKVM